MNGLLCTLSSVLSTLVTIYTLILFIYALMSWIPDTRRWMGYLAPLVEPVLSPLRRIIPPLGGLDLSFLVLILVLQLLVRPLIGHFAINACSIY